MQIHRLIVGLGLSVLASCADGDAPVAGRQSGAETPAEIRNVVLISLDTLRADHLGCYGYGRETTPNIDALAEESLLFERCFATAPWTLVSHMSMLTGLYPEQHGVLTDRFALAPEIPILTERLVGAGFETAAIRYPGWIEERYGFHRGFEHFELNDGGETASRKIAHFMRVRDPSRPLFMFVHLFDVHSAPLEEQASLLYEPPPAYRDIFVEGAAQRFEAGDALKLWRSVERATPEQMEALIALYDGGVRFVDELVGKWVAAWEESGFLDETLLIITSDHGESLGQRNGVLENHGGLFDEGLHVPLIVRLPNGRRGGERISTPVNHVDIVPTVIEAVGLDRDAWLPGISLLSELPASREVMNAAWHDQRAYLRWPQKAVTAPDGRYPSFVSDLDADPNELKILDAKREPETFKTTLDGLRGAFEVETRGLGLPAQKPAAITEGLTDEERLRLEALGYLTEDSGAVDEE